MSSCISVLASFFWNIRNLCPARLWWLVSKRKILEANFLSQVRSAFPVLASINGSNFAYCPSGLLKLILFPVGSACLTDESQKKGRVRALGSCLGPHDMLHLLWN